MPYLDALRREVIPALGCTEPAAAALCAAGAAHALGEPVKRITLRVSPYIFKNGMNVGIPNVSGATGLTIAAALGALTADPSKGLQALESLSPELIARARRMESDGSARVELAKTPERIHLEAVCESDEHSSRCVIATYHNQIVLMERDGAELFRPDRLMANETAVERAPMSVRGIYEFCRDATIQSLGFLNEVVTVNCRIADEGMSGEWGLKIGKTLRRSAQASFFHSDVAQQAIALTAAAADARMAGCDLPVMSTAGSGNQGLTASLPVIVAARHIQAAEGQMLRALAMSLLITIHTKTYLGRLSALCGCGISAAIGVSAGLVYLMGGEYEAIEASIRTMAADITGMVCDGAKPGCALKIATSVHAAFQAASLALMGIGASDRDGIVHTDIEETLRSIGELGGEAMEGVNDAILKLMRREAV